MRTKERKEVLEGKVKVISNLLFLYDSESLLNKLLCCMTRETEIRQRYRSLDTVYLSFDIFDKYLTTECHDRIKYLTDV